MPRAQTNRPAVGRTSAARGTAGGERASGRPLVSRRRWRCRWCCWSGAGLFVRTLQNLYRAERGIDLDRVVVVRARAARQRPANPRDRRNLDRIYRDLLVRIEAMPGVQSVSLRAIVAASARSRSAFPVVPPAGGAPIRLDGSIVYPRYFATMGIPIVKGRDFSDDDLRPDAAAAVLVNEPFVREVLNGREPLGVAHGVMTQGPGRGAGQLVPR